MSDRVKISAPEADELMVAGDQVHTFASIGNVLLGCDVSRARLLQLAADGKMELGGEQSEKMNHGLAVNDDGRWLFVETKKKEAAPPNSLSV